MAYLHEKPGYESLANVRIVVTTGEVCACAFQIESVHDARQLSAHVVGAL